MMKSFAVVLFVQFLLGVYAEDSNVKVLTEDNFDEVVSGSSFTFVKFYAPWCGHCKALAPTWEELANAFKDEPDVTIAKVDATVHTKLASKHNVMGYPTLLMFKGAGEPEPYRKARSLADLTKYVNDEAGTARKPDGSYDASLGIVKEIENYIRTYDCGDLNAQECLQTLAASVAEQQNLAPHDAEKRFAEYYVKALQKASQKGKEYFSSEIARLKKLAKSSATAVDAKKYALGRVNILQSLRDESAALVKDEL